ncbi:tetratricopeptide repeat protein [Dongia sp.]|uniref:tetratricopeptide repeat protein n=1 Tax=Dongia sp. TaxID=1977262 RepID=UPI0035B32B9A
MSIHRTPRRRRAAVIHAALLTLALVAAAFLLPVQPACAAPEDLEEIHRLELQGQKVDAFLKLKELAPTGDPEAQYKLAGYYHYGDAGPANYKLALEWYERAARQGHTDAMLGIAVLLDPANARITSIPDDRGRAFTWLTIAATLMTKKSDLAIVEGLRDKLKGELSSAELNAALAEAMAFQPALEQPMLAQPQ